MGDLSGRLGVDQAACRGRGAATEGREQLGIGRSTVDRALASERPPKYERPPMETSFSPFEARVRALLVEHPSMPATVIAERVEWSGSITWFREKRQTPQTGASPARSGGPAVVGGG